MKELFQPQWMIALGLVQPVLALDTLEIGLITVSGPVHARESGVHPLLSSWKGFHGLIMARSTIRCHPGSPFRVHLLSMAWAVQWSPAFLVLLPGTPYLITNLHGYMELKPAQPAWTNSKENHPGSPWE